MIYPQKLNSKEGEQLLKIFLIISIIVAILLIVINNIVTPDIPWSAFANCGIIYIWITVIYSIKRNTNIAGHVLLQIIIMSMAALYIDDKIGFYGWSTNNAIPIILIVANVTMLILTIVSYKRYIRYAIYQLVIVLITLVSIIFVMRNTNILGNSAVIISIINMLISLILSYKDIKEEIIRKFHM